MKYHADAITLPAVFDQLDNLRREIFSREFALLGFDFDGTLAPIAENPDAVRMPEKNRRLLADLSRCDGVSILVLSGRSLEDLKGIVHLDRVIYGGDHGFEIEFPDGGRYLPAGESPAVSPEEINRRLAPRIRAFPGVRIDVKRFSLTVHYRQADEKTGAALGDLLQDELTGTGYLFSPGRKCWEIHPQIKWDKGAAYQLVFRRIQQEKGTGLRLYVGDDRTDESVFALMGEEDWSIIIPSAEKERKTRARYRLETQSDVTLLLEKLLEAYREKFQ